MQESNPLNALRAVYFLYSPASPIHDIRLMPSERRYLRLKRVKKPMSKYCWGCARCTIISN
nr:MAG TPA: hypothetical protein [Caudoviricetes sp.]